MFLLASPKDPFWDLWQGPKGQADNLGYLFKSSLGYFLKSALHLVAGVLDVQAKRAELAGLAGLQFDKATWGDCLGWAGLHCTGLG